MLLIWNLRFYYIKYSTWYALMCWETETAIFNLFCVRLVRVSTIQHHWIWCFLLINITGVVFAIRSEPKWFYTTKKVVSVITFWEFLWSILHVLLNWNVFGVIWSGFWLKKVCVGTCESKRRVFRMFVLKVVCFCFDNAFLY